jgi:hypothetical protein
MTDYRKDIDRIKDPENINEAVYASSPYVLRKAFESDRSVVRLISAGREVVPLISKEIEKHGMKLSEITLSCYAYILQKIDLEAALKILKPLFAKAIKNPGPFFVNFSAHALRQKVNLPIKPLQILYTKAELLETLEVINKLKIT